MFCIRKDGNRRRTQDRPGISADFLVAYSARNLGPKENSFMQVEKQQINVAIIGAGVVGRGTASILVENAQEIAARAVPIGLRWLVNRNLAKAEAVKEQLGLSDLRLAEDWRPAVEDPETDVVVEVIGGTDVAFDILSTALSNGKSAVTANKDLIATRGGELLSIAKAHGSELFFEASVGGGIPIIQPLKESLAGNRVEQILGIVNGTTNFILTNMTEQGMDFETALAQAQELGYAEWKDWMPLEKWRFWRPLLLIVGLHTKMCIAKESQRSVHGIFCTATSWGMSLRCWESRVATKKRSRFGYIQ